MTNENADDKAIVVLTQEDIDITLRALEEEMFQLPDDQAAELEGVHDKFMAIDRADSGSDYRVK